MFLKSSSPGIYVLRVQKRIEEGYDQDNILRFEVPEGKLVYFGTIKIVIDKIMVPSLPRNRMPNVASMKFNYHYAGIDEDETLKLFADQYPQAYSSYKDKIIRVLFSSRSKTHVTLIPGDYSADTGMEPAVAFKSASALGSAINSR